MVNQKKKISARVLSVILTVMMVVTLIPAALLSETENVSAATVSEPRVTSSGTTWDCVYFGSYPQTEIVAEASQCGTYGNSYWGLSSDYAVDPGLYEKLQNASYDSNGDTTVDGVKYRRIKQSDATYGTSGSSNCYNWSDSVTYHYFRYDKIKWRVLETSGGYALLLADKALDAQRYNTEYTPITWEKSTIRSWLNGYGADSNTYGTDYTQKNFIDSAFPSAEQSAIKTAEVINDNSIRYGIAGGNDTKDKVFLLAESDVWNTDKATSHGFSKAYSDYDKARRSNSTTYAKAMGTESNTDSEYAGNCYWWLRSPADYSDDAASVHYSGYVDTGGYRVHAGTFGVRPALYLNLSSTIWSKAGTVSSEGSGTEDNKSTGSAGISEDQLYGEYASYLNNNAYSTIISNLVSDTDAVLDSGNDFWLYVKTTLKWIGDVEAVRIIKTHMGKDVTADELAEKQALALVNSVSGNSSLMEDIMEDVKNGYKWTSETYSVVSKGFKYASDYKAIKELVASGYCYSEESARELIGEMEDNWSEIDKIFKAAGVTVNAAQLTVQVAMEAEADYRVVSVLKENATKETWLYKGLDRIEKKIQKGMGKELVNTLLEKGFFEELADGMAKTGLELIPGVKYVLRASKIVSNIIPVKDADQEVNAMIAGTVFSNLSVMRKGYVAKIIQNNKNGGTISTDKLKEEYRIIFDAYIESLKQYIKYAEVKGDSNAKKKLEREYSAAKKYLNYDKYIELCLNNANADWQYNSSDGKATITGINKSGAASASTFSALKATASYDDSDSLLILDIPETIDGLDVKNIGAEAFKDDTSIKSVYIPGTVELLEDSAFNGCSNIDNVFLSNGIEEIGADAFNGCSALAEINIPYSIKSIGENAFSGIDSLTLNASDGSEGQNYAENNSNIIFEETDCEVTSIAVTNKPSKLEYMMDEDLDTTGMTVEATYEDGSEKDVTDEVYCDFEEKSIGISKVNVYFADKSASFDVNIKPSQCEYTVTYENEYCEEIADRFTGYAMAGDEVELIIPEIEGYEPDKESIVKIIGSENDFVVTYTSEPKIQISDIQIKYETEFKYTGKQIKPEVQIEYQGNKLYENRDYYVDYDENTYPDKGEIIITGTGEFCGSRIIEFDIKAPAVAAQKSVAAVLYGYDDFKVSWSSQKVTGATVKYKVEYKRYGGKWYTIYKGTTATSVKKVNLTDGVRYAFRVTPYVTVSGKNYYGKSKSTGYIYTLKKLNRPTVKKSSKYYARVYWNNIPGETGYEIARSKYSTKKFVVVKRVSYKYKSARIKTSRYKKYYYKVRAYKTVNGKRIYGPWSSVKSYTLR